MAGDLDTLEPQASSPPETVTPVDPVVNEAAQAQEAREAAALRMGTAARGGRPSTAQPQQPAPEAPQTDPDNPYSRFGKSEDDGIDLYERFRLNSTNAFYRGTLAGSARLAAMANLVRTEDGPDIPPWVKQQRDADRENYKNIIGDLARYDLIAPWGTTAEAAVALGGSLVGSLPSPESIAGIAAKGATMLARTGMAALQQGAIMGATDPVVQGLNIYAGVETHYDPLKTLGAVGIGAILGGGLHIGGELIGNAALKRMTADLAAEDKSFYKPAQDLEIANAGRSEPAPPTGERPAEAPTGTPSERPTERPTEAPGGEARPTREVDGAPTGEYGSEPRRMLEEQEPQAALVARRGGDGEMYSIAVSSEDVRPTDVRLEVDAKGEVAPVGGKDIGPIRRSPPSDELAAKSVTPTDTSEFRGWFGDSKVVDPEGNPQVVFHGTAKKFDTFSKEKSPGGITWFTSDRGMIERGEVGAQGRGHIMELYASIKKPAGWDQYDKYGLDELVSRGYDGVILPNKDGSFDGFVFEPEQLKSVNNRGTFDPSNPNTMAMKRAGGGVLPMQRVRPEAGAPDTTSTTGTALATVPEAGANPKDTAIRSLQQQAFDFADAIGFPLRQGRMAGQAKSTLGVFKSKSGVVRVREVPDFEVVAHEGGHYIEAKIGPDLTALTNAFDTELRPLVSNAGAYDPAVHVKEGFAEYIRRYMGNPAHAQSVAPGFTIAFRDFMESRAPEMMRAIDNASAAYRAYLEAPSVDAIGSVIRSQDEGPKGWRKWIPKKLQREEFPVIVKTMMQDMVTGQVDQYAPTARALREMLKGIKDAQGGRLVDLKTADNPEKLLRMFAQSQQAAVLDMNDGVRGFRSTVPEGPSLTDALAKATGGSRFGRWNQELVDAFSTYLVSRRASVLWDRFNRGDLQNPPTAFSRGDANIAMAELERANPAFREASDMVHAWTRQLLKKQYEGGLIDADLYGRLIQEEFYVPFMRDLSDKPLSADGGAGGGSGAPGDRVAKTIHAIKGSSRDIKNPIESLMMQAFLVNRTLRHNDIIRSLVGVADQAGIVGGRFVEKIPANEMKKYTFDLRDAIERAAKEKGMTPDDTKVLINSLSDTFGEDPLVGSFFRAEPAGARGEPIVFYKEGGEMKAARIMSGDEGHALYENLTELPKGIADVGMQLLSASSTVLRSGITTNPVYALTNYIRDQMATAILRSDYIPFVSGMKGIRDEFAQGESAKLYAYGGGISAGTAIAPLDKAVDAEINALAKQGYLVNRFTSFKGFLEFASFTEAGTRNSVFDTVYTAKRAQGLSEYEAMMEAAWQARDLMDFGRWGSKTLAVRRLTPFVNAHIQGLSKGYRTLIEPLYREVLTTSEEGAKANAILGLTKVMAIGGALGAAWAALHSDDEIYRDASPEMKGTHFVTTIGNKILLIPKPFELSLGFTAGEYGYQRLMKGDQRAAEQFAHAAYDVLMPPVPIGANPAIKTSYELLLGRSSYFGSDIVPDTLKGKAPAEQYTDRTSSLAKAVGSTINVSPMKVDYAIGGFFGTWGRDLLALSSGVDERAPAQNWEDRVFLRRFIKDPTRSSDATTQFWKFMGQTTGKFNQAVLTYDSLNKSFRDDQAKDFLAKMPSAERAYTIMKSAANEDGKAAFDSDQKRLFPLQRAYDAVTILNGMRRELSDNSFKTYEDSKNVQFSPRQRRDIIDSLRELAQMEMRNSFVIMKQPGWTDRPLMDLEPTMAKIRAVSPMVADEVATRYATGRVYTTKSVATSYEKLKDEVVRNGSQADINDVTADAKAAGYEFGGERVRKPQKRRVLIEPRTGP